jgi:uncharacterized protein (DUF58 family)
VIPPVAVLAFSVPCFVLAGLALQNGPLLFVAGAIVFLVVAAWTFGTEAAKRVSCERSCHPRAFEGAGVELRLRLSNRSGFPLLGVELADRFLPQDMLPKSVVVPRDVPAHHALQVAYQGACLRHRGRYVLGPMEVRFFDPLGLMDRRRAFKDEASFTVLPKPLPLAKIGLDGRSSLLSAFNPDRQTQGQSLKFFGVREYRAGDPLRFVHWKASARLGRLVVRQFEASVSAQISLFLDLALTSLAGLGVEATVEYAIRAACALAAAAVAEGHEVQLFGESEGPLTTPLGSGQGHLGYLLERLATIKPKGAIPLHEVVSRYADRVPQGSQVFLILATTAGEPADWAAPVSFLRGRYARIAVIMVDDRTFVQHRKWRRELSGDAYPPLVPFFLAQGATVRLIARGADLVATLAEG